MFRNFLILFSIVVLSGCKIHFATYDGGEIHAQNAGFVCEESQLCVATVEDTNFDESFVAVPKAGYEFSGWLKAGAHFCGDNMGSCDLATAAFEGNQVLLDILHSDKKYYLVATFKPECHSGSSELGGMYREPLRLCAQGSPYSVTSNIQLGPDAPLYIEPGVTIRSTSHSGNRLVSYANIYIQGTATKKVQVEDLRIETSYSGETNVIDISHAKITFPRSGETEIRNLDMVFSADGGYARVRDSEIHAHIFFNSQTNSRVIDHMRGGFPSISETKIEGNVFIDSGLLLLIDKDILIKNNIWLGEGNEIVVREAGTSKITAVHNSFLATTPEGGTGFVGNDPTEFPWVNSVIIEDSGEAFTVDFRHNFWGTQNASKVADMIWDANDTFELDIVVPFKPILGSPHPKTPLASN